MPGVKPLRKIQMGRETTAGTAVAATAVWRGLGTIEDQREVVHVEEDIGYLSGVDRTYTPTFLAGLEFEEVEATFEQLPHILEAGMKQVVTGVQDGAGSGYIYDYVMPTTAQPTISTYTLEGGDNQAAEEMEYSFVQSFTLAGVAKEAIKMSSVWAGRQVSTCSFTGALSLPSVETILFQKTKLYIDDVGGTIGTTQKSNTLLGFTLNVKTGLVPVFTGDGNKYFSFAKSVDPEWNLEITFEHDGTATAEKQNWRDETARQIQLLVEGSAFTTAGTDYSNKSLIIDQAGKWAKFNKIGEQDGNDIITASFVGKYNATAALFAGIKVVNGLSVLP